jgi:hypothetical protein
MVEMYSTHSLRLRRHCGNVARPGGGSGACHVDGPGVYAGLGQPAMGRKGVTAQGRDCASVRKDARKDVVTTQDRART